MNSHPTVCILARTFPLFFAVVLVTACGDGGGGSDALAEPATPAAQSVEFDPCNLVNSDEASKALGVTAAKQERPKEANFPPRLTTCRYTGERGAGVAVMTVMVRRGSSEGEAKIGFQGARDQFADAAAVMGLGDQAFWIGNQVHVLRGSDYLSLTGDFDRATAESLAKTALTRLR